MAKKKVYLQNRIADVTHANVPLSFTKSATNNNITLLQSGQLNKVAHWPRICNEHVESSREIQGVISSSNNVGQVFRASKDNITQLGVSLQSAASVDLDDFESYADSPTLQTEWVASTALATLEGTIVQGGSKAMKLPMTTNGDTWTKTISSTDYTGYTGKFWAKFTAPFASIKLEVFIGDGTNTKSFVLVQEVPNGYQEFFIDEASMIDDGATTPVITAITKIGYRVLTKRIGNFVYIDTLAAVPPPGQVQATLYNMGSTLPESGVITLDSGTQYTKIGPNRNLTNYLINLEGGFRIYHLNDFNCGNQKNIPDAATIPNEPLIKDNYYAIVLSYIDTDVSVYGPDTDFENKYYTHGYAFTTPDTSTAITAIGPYSDLMFHIFSSQDVWVYRTEYRLDVSPGEDSGITIYVEDRNMVETAMIRDFERDPVTRREDDFRDRPKEALDGSKVEFYLNSGSADTNEEMHTEVSFYYEPPNAHL